ncbi:EAL domain-containing protein [Hydrogenimonas sp.]
MKRLLTLNLLLFLAFMSIIVATGYSLHRLKVSFTDNILGQYAQEIDKDIVQLRLNLQTLINDTGERSTEVLPSILTRYINIHPVTRRLQIYVGDKLVADSYFAKTPLPPSLKKRCLPLPSLSSKTIREGIFCYYVKLRIYRDGRRVPATLYILLDPSRLSSEISTALRRMMVPVGIMMLVVIALTATFFWASVVRNFSRLIAWSDNPEKRPPDFRIREFRRISDKIHTYAKSIAEQFRLLKESAERESNLRSIMQTVTKINELLVTEKEEEPFLQKASEILSKHRNYFGTSIFLEKSDGEIVPATTIVTIDDGKPRWDAASICIGIDELRSLHDPEKSYLIRRVNECRSCRSDHLEILFPQPVKEAWVAIFPLRYDKAEAPLGYLVVNSTVEKGFDDEEIDMLVELAGDIGFAIQAFRREKAFHEMLYRHPLTNLPNTAAFHVELSGHRGDTLAMANIDRFKQINALYGVKIADEILKLFARYLQSAIPEDVGLFQHVGDEFLLLFPRRYEKERVEELLLELLGRIESHLFLYGGLEVMLSVRFGVTTLQDDGALRECHMALQEAKLRHSAIRWYSPDLNALVKEDMIQTYRTLKEALEEGRVFNAYQAIYDLKKSEVSHYEALIRIALPDGRILSPAAFIDFAKQTRLYPELSATVLENALRDAEKLGTAVSVNLSVVDILNEKFRESLFETLEGLPDPHRLIFEIIESENIDNYEQTAAFIRRVKSYGCRIAIDDFGSGYANFQHIAQLDADMLKIDGTLVKDIVTDPAIRAIVKNIAAIARELRMVTIAEFVSNDEILAAVGELGIDMAQGYRLHKPEPLEEIVKRKSAETGQ